MPLAPDPDDDHPVLKVLAGVAAAATATVAWFFVVALVLELTNDRAYAAQRVGAGLISVLGLVLIIWRRTRLMGIGIAVGAPVAFFVEILALAILIAGATY